MGFINQQTSLGATILYNKRPSSDHPQLPHVSQCSRWCWWVKVPVHTWPPCFCWSTASSRCETIRKRWENMDPVGVFGGFLLLEKHEHLAMDGVSVFFWGGNASFWRAESSESSEWSRHCQLVAGKAHGWRKGVHGQLVGEGHQWHQWHQKRVNPQR